MGNVIAEFGIQLHDDGSMTSFGFRSDSAAASPGAAPPADDPWAGIDAQPAQQQGQQWQPPQQQWSQQPAQQYTQPAQTQQSHGPACMHGPLKPVPGGYSQRAQKAYAAFWACQAPRGQAQCKLDQKQLPPVPA